MNAASVATLLSNPERPPASLPNTAKGAPMNAAKADKTAKDFESLFVSQMLEQMFGDSSGEDAFGDKDTNDVYKGLMIDEYSKQITKAGGIGIAAYVKHELLKTQEM